MKKNTCAWRAAAGFGTSIASASHWCGATACTLSGVAAPAEQQRTCTSSQDLTACQTAALLMELLAAAARKSACSACSAATMASGLMSALARRTAHARVARRVAPTPSTAQQSQHAAGQLCIRCCHAACKCKQMHVHTRLVLNNGNGDVQDDAQAADADRRGPPQVLVRRRQPARAAVGRHQRQAAQLCVRCTACTRISAPAASKCSMP